MKRIMMCLFLVTVKCMRIYPQLQCGKNYGISSYIRGSAEQLIWQSYYLLEDTLKYEKPQVVILNVLAMTESDAKNEAYNRMTLDGMKLSKYKIAFYKGVNDRRREYGQLYISIVEISLKME